MSFAFLILAGIFEVCGVLILKKISQGEHVFYWMISLWIVFSLSLFFLKLSMGTLSMSVAYAIWTGIGAFGGVILSVLFFKENFNFYKALFIVLIIFSVIGLKLLD